MTYIGGGGARGGGIRGSRGAGLDREGRALLDREGRALLVAVRCSELGSALLGAGVTRDGEGAERNRGGSFSLRIATACFHRTDHTLRQRGFHQSERISSVEATKRPVGVLHVKVVRAFNLLKMVFLGKSDPYVKLSLSEEGLPSKKTSIKMSNLNPEWNENFMLIVKDPATQVLQLRVFAWEKVKMHDKLGMQVIPLSLLTPYETKEFTLDLLKNLNLPLSLLTPYETKEFTLDLLKNLNPNDPQNKKNRGKIVVELTFDPFKEESGKFSGTLDGDGHSSIRLPEETSSSGGGVLSLTIIDEACDEVHLLMKLRLMAVLCCVAVMFFY
ncbi:uncharacterized protein A4U43_C09F7850 [Asparagus officinalis]|uniref:C2 domain-containing protein n=1 Tax=Asparagus officinalis TaxID=4686 RepID=A0A5P1E607_ASPOF|nr:uncharacterized protein A4U43_C09F7850 [Asparagus officinalis]